MNSTEEIHQNAIGKDCTFVSELNKGIFDQKAFWKLFSALNSFNEESKNMQAIELKTMSDYSKVQCLIQNAVASHYNPDDGFTLLNIDGNFGDYVRRLTTIFSSFGEGFFENDDFDDGLKPPKP